MSSDVFPIVSNNSSSLQKLDSHRGSEKRYRNQPEALTHKVLAKHGQPEFLDQQRLKLSELMAPKRGPVPPGAVSQTVVQTKLLGQPSSVTQFTLNNYGNGLASNRVYDDSTSLTLAKPGSLATIAPNTVLNKRTSGAHSGMA